MSATKAAQALLKYDTELASFAADLAPHIDRSFGDRDTAVLQYIRHYVMNTWTLSMLSEAVGSSEEQIVAALLHLEPLRTGTTCVCRGQAALLFKQEHV